MRQWFTAMSPAGYLACQAVLGAVIGAILQAVSSAVRKTPLLSFERYAGAWFFAFGFMLAGIAMDELTYAQRLRGAWSLPFLACQAAAMAYAAHLMLLPARWRDRSNHRPVWALFIAVWAALIAFFLYNFRRLGV